jgi:hypothetical protein
MVRRQKVSKSQGDTFSATGRVAGFDVTVSRVGDVGRSIDGGYSTKAAVYEVVPVTKADRVSISGYLIPATFRVDGLPFDLTYDVGYVNDGTRRRYGVTRIEAGRPDPTTTLRKPAAAGVNVERVTESALVRLALRASIVHGYAYAPGCVIDPKSGDVIGRVKAGDPFPSGAVIVGVEPGTASRRAGVVPPLSKSPEPVLRSRTTDDVEAADVRLLTGQSRPGRRAEPIDDADLRLIARLYDEAEADPTVTNTPDYVRLRLREETKGRLTYGESWVRKQAVAARRRGFLKHGKRRRKKGGK